MKKNIIKKITIYSLLAFTALSAEPYTISVPEVPKNEAIVPKVDYVIVNGKAIEVDHKSFQIEEKKTNMIGSSKRVPPSYTKKEKVTDNKDMVVGNVENNRVSAYLYSSLIPVEDVISKLTNSGFNVLAKYKTDKKGKYVAIVFTNDDLSKLSAVDNRGFASSLRLLIDNENSRISILNPIYVSKAFMQDSYDEKVAKKTLDSLHKIFTDLKASEDIVKFTRLPRYQFMQNMPYYQDMIKVASGKTDKLLNKARKSKKIKLVYEQKLENGSTLIGIQLSKRTGKFVKKIGYKNSQLLPYPILIENNEAKILDPKYYIALMYPNLSMSEFMTIATVPGAIQKDCDRVFR